MFNNKAQLNDLKTELTSYKKKLLDIQKTYKNNSRYDVDNISNSLSNILEEARQAYSKLESASEEEWDVLLKKANVSFKKLKENFDDVVKASSEQAQEYAQNIEQYSHKVIDCTEEYIKDNPVKSVLYALGLGYFIGRFLK